MADVPIKYKPGCFSIRACSSTLHDFKKKFAYYQKTRYTEECNSYEAGYIMDVFGIMITWIPANVFEKAFSKAETDLDNLQIEATSLNYLIESLNISKDDSYLKFMQSLQKEAMTTYMDCLTCVIDYKSNSIISAEHKSFTLSGILVALNCRMAAKRLQWENKFIFKSTIESLENEFIILRDETLKSNTLWLPSIEDMFANDWQLVFNKKV